MEPPYNEKGLACNEAFSKICGSDRLHLVPIIEVERHSIAALDGFIKPKGFGADDFVSHVANVLRHKELDVNQALRSLLFVKRGELIARTLNVAHDSPPFLGFKNLTHEGGASLTQVSIRPISPIERLKPFPVL
jgi:hypothetical protein